MTGHPYNVEVSEYVDGTLTPERLTVFEPHLATCARCQALAADFRTLREATSRLEDDTPPAYVWTRLSAQLTAASEPRRAWVSWLVGDLAWRSAVAAGILVAAIVAGSWQSWREVSTVGTGQRPQLVAFTPPTYAAPSHVEAAAAIQAEISNLQQIVGTNAAILPEQTKAVFDAASSEIDEAIGQPRAVLAREPSDELARDSMFEALRSKLALLQEMIALINQMRQGNQDEAARIVSGMQP